MVETIFLHDLLLETTRIFRKGAVATQKNVGPVQVTEVFGYPHYEGPEASGYVLVDTHFTVVGVDREKAEARRADLDAWLRAYPMPERLAGGPSYIEIGAVIGSQEDAFRLFALGSVLGMWKVMLPSDLPGVDAELADDLAGRGFVFMSGWKP